jgi:signal recognition particle receptor subunit beta
VDFIEGNAPNVEIDGFRLSILGARSLRGHRKLVRYEGIMDETQIYLAEKTLETLVKHRSKVWSALKDGLSRVRDGKVSVLVFGLGGVGKTTTTKLLSDGQAAAQENTVYVPTADAERSRSQKNFYISVWDTPGQDEFRIAGWDDAFKGMEGSRKCIVINLVSYGYNSLGLTFKELKQSSTYAAKAKVIDEYLRRERRKELDQIRALLERLKGVQCRVKLLTIVNKQDLWWRTRVKVVNHYSKGAYSRPISNFANSRPKGSFTHSIKAVSLCPINLRTTDGEVLAETCSGYDLEIREIYFGHLLAELKQIVS